MGKHVVVIGGGVAGLEAAGRLAKTGLEVSIIEKKSETGGHLNDWFRLFPDRRSSEEVKKYLSGIISDKKIRVIKETSIEKVDRKHQVFSVMTSGGEELKADAILVSTGFDLFRSERKEELGYGIYDNVITSADLESMFRQGKILTAGGKKPQKIGIIHCVGSRDEKVGNLYCSKLCCVTAVKQAIEIREMLPESRVFCFYMDMRMGGAHYEELYREAQENWGVSFIRGKVSEAAETINGKIAIKVEDTLSGRPLKIEMDMLILMAGMEMSEGGKSIAAVANLKTGENKFFVAADHHFGNNLSNIEGIFYAGACTAPMNITETLSHARAAVLEIMDYLGENGKQ
jgi:heterodisulfide reductase subunit A